MVPVTQGADVIQNSRYAGKGVFNYVLGSVVCDVRHWQGKLRINLAFGFEELV